MGNKLTVHYAMIQSVDIMGYCTIYSFASIYLLSRGFTNSQIGLTMTLASAFALLFQPIVASFARQDKNTIPLRKIVAIILGVFTVSSFLLLVIPDIVLPTANSQYASGESFHYPGTTDYFHVNGAYQ